jgi:cytoplasmic polyadenylation element-binding protein
MSSRWIVLKVKCQVLTTIFLVSLSQDECSVQNLIENCIIEDDKLYICVSSPTIKNKPVQIRPWRLSDADFVLDASMSLDPRKTVFVGGVPRPLKACK